jgi:hypothetical protein
MTDNQQPTLAEIRATRHTLQDQEDVVSFVRRLAQGRLDLVRDEQRRRISGAEPDATPLEMRLAEVFGQQHGGGSARPPRETDVPADHPMVRELDELCDGFNFASMENLPDNDLAELANALEMYERMCSQQRHELFEQIDALTTELVRRVREGGGAGAVVRDN